jgi:chorismate synthase
MPGNQFGQALVLTSWGESHGTAIGGVLDGIPPGIQLNTSLIQQALNRRRPGQSIHVTPRLESDEIEILSGLYDGKTLGTPLSFMIKNSNHDSAAYDSYKNIFRPGHADYGYWKKYQHYDHRGGGRASARETAVRVAAGAIAQQVLTTILDVAPLVRAALVQLGTCTISYDHWDWQEREKNPFFCPDAQAVPVWETYLTKVKDQGRSVGAIIEVCVQNIPAGLGEPVYDKLDADLAKALMSINAVKGVEIGDGFACVSASQGYDEMGNDDELFLSNRAGGIIGGISTGQDIICRLALKPTSSTRQPRQTITKDGHVVTTEIHGRHDPCVGIRAVPIAEAMVNLVLADHLLRWRGQCGEYPILVK